MNIYLLLTASLYSNTCILIADVSTQVTKSSRFLYLFYYIYLYIYLILFFIFYLKIFDTYLVIKNAGSFTTSVPTLT